MDVNGLVWVEECRSTNDLALAWLDRPEVHAVGADRQTGGRGRRGRSWFSPAGDGLYLTWLARPPFGPERGTVLPMLAAVAVAEVVEALGVRPLLGWPNDLLIAGRKLGGILCEARVHGEAWSAAVGVGLDLRTPTGGFPSEINAVALDEHVQRVPAARDLAGRVLEALEDWLARAAVSSCPVFQAWETYGPRRGTRMRRGELEGRYAGLGPGGALRLETSGGEVQIHTGEVELVDWQEG